MSETANFDLIAGAMPDITAAADQILAEQAALTGDMGTEYTMPFGTEIFTNMPANTQLGPLVCAQALGTSVDDTSTGTSADVS